MALNFPNVEFLKFPEIDEVDGGILEKNFDHFFRKIPHQNEVKIHISHKGYAKGGLRVQHEVHAKLVVDGKQYFAKETGWKLLEVMQDVLKKLEKETLKEHEKK